MIKLKLFICLFILNGALYAQNDIIKKKDTLVWKSNILKWNDFQSPKNGSYNTISAASSTGIAVIGKYNDLKLKYSCRVYAYFIKKKSWVNLATSYLLQHEQLHFDLTELYARKLRKEYSKMNQEDFIKNAAQKYNEISKKLYDYQDLYDLETNHSKNTLKQKEWEIKIKKELLEYEEYRFEEVSID